MELGMLMWNYSESDTRPDLEGLFLSVGVFGLVLTGRSAEAAGGVEAEPEE